jgi:ribosomal protein S18 acetylase RimI-like enzyme
MQRFVAQTYGVEQQGAEISDPHMVTRLLVDGSEIAGFYQLRLPESHGEFSSEGGEIARFYVSRAWHGKGLAASLMLAALDELRSAGATRAWLGVWEENARAIAFYLKSGFKTVGTQSFELGGVMQSDLVMAQSLLDA